MKTVDVEYLIEEAFINQSIFGVKLGMFPEEVFSLFPESKIVQGEDEGVYYIYLNDVIHIEIGRLYDRESDEYLEVDSIHIWLDRDYEIKEQNYSFKDFLSYCASSGGLIVPVAIVDVYHWLYYYIGNDVSVDADVNDDGVYFVSRIILRSPLYYAGVSKWIRTNWDTFRDMFGNKAMLAKPRNAPI